MSEDILEKQLFEIILNKEMPEDIKVAKVDMLIKLGVDVNRIKRGFSALGIAKENNLDLVAGVLEENGAIDKRVSPIDAKKLGKNLIDSIRFHVDFSDVNEFNKFMKFIEDGADLNAKDDLYGNTALIWAAKYGVEQYVDVLLENGAKVDETNKIGRTALMTTTIWGYGDIAYKLVMHGADPLLKDMTGKDAFEYARNDEVLGKIKDAYVKIKTENKDNDEDKLAIMQHMNYLLGSRR
jgi:ankyrin repeat protein